MNTVLFINSVQPSCGVYQYGKRVFDILQQSTTYSYKFCSIGSLEEYTRAISEYNPIVIIYNYHSSTLPFLNASTICKTTLNLCIPHESACSFANILLDIDPTIQDTAHRITLPRPLSETHTYLSPESITDREISSFIHNGTDSSIPIIGSFGFRFNNKGFTRVVQLVTQQYDQAIIKLLIPDAHYGDPRSTPLSVMIEEFRRNITNPGIQLQVISKFFTDDELYTFLHSTTLNIFLYDTMHGRGISSTIDYALSVKKPIAISDSYMFRHIYNDSICAYKTPLSVISAESPSYLSTFNEKWSNAKFIEKIEQLIRANL